MGIIQPLPKPNTSELHPAGLKKSREKELSKENESKHMNGIKPYIGNPPLFKERKISKRESQKQISHSPYTNINSSCNMDSNSKPKNKKTDKSERNENSSKKLD